VIQRVTLAPITLLSFEIILMQRFIPIFGLLLLSFCQSSQETDQQAVPPLLQKSIAYHDPEGNWQQFKARLYLIHTDTSGKETPFELEIDNNTGYFSHISHRDKKEIVKGISPDGTAFFLIDGKKEISQEEREKYKMTRESAEGTRNFYLHLYGLPMKLRDAGTLVSDSVYIESLHGKDYQVMQVSYEPSVGNDTWFFYLNPTTAAMEAYSFHWGNPEAGEYVLLEEELEVNEIKLPRVRKWYFTKEDQYLGADILIKAEELDAYRE
jgi:hypothetical protein